ncbi:reverse transcriptase family protein [Hominifimenecus sp. rT4P-3]|uniref:reverse transcriptase family protein n=1 Tax=Hominifimenecus sp. rT4P-3 TaxID=3242979 RepID=UPI003DA63715
MILYEESYFLSHILNTTKEKLNRILADKENAYLSFTLPKKHGVRRIDGLRPGSELKKIQRRLAEGFLNQIPLPVPVKGFVKGENYVSYLRAHCGSQYFLRLDIQDFFPSIREEQLRSCLSEFVQEPAVLDEIVGIGMLHGSLPQGAVTSPALSNLVFRRMDQRILKYCQKLSERYIAGEVFYTRYADDLLFSSQTFDFSANPYFYGMISHILGEHGFRLQREKTSFQKGTFVSNGFVVGEDVHLSRSRRQEINRFLYEVMENQKKWKGGNRSEPYRLDRKKIRREEELLQTAEEIWPDRQGRDPSFFDKEQLIYYLCGYRAFLISVVEGNRERTDAVRQMEKLLRKLELVLRELSAS